MSRVTHLIEAESFRILRGLADLAHLPPLSRAVAERVIHASADLSYADDLALDEDALRRGLEALRSGAPVIADVRMVAAGITAPGVRCALDEPVEASRASTRTAAGVRAATRAVGDGAVWVIGCAPTALAELLGCQAAPRFVVGLPVGFVGATEAKAALRASGVPAVTNRSAKGGSAVAAAALNALLFFEEER